MQGTYMEITEKLYMLLEVIQSPEINRYTLVFLVLYCFNVNSCKSSITYKNTVVCKSYGKERLCALPYYILFLDLFIHSILVTVAMASNCNYENNYELCFGRYVGLGLFP